MEEGKRSKAKGARIKAQRLKVKGQRSKDNSSKLKAESRRTAGSLEDSKKKANLIREERWT